MRFTRSLLCSRAVTYIPPLIYIYLKYRDTIFALSVLEDYLVGRYTFLMSGFER